MYNTTKLFAEFMFALERTKKIKQTYKKIGHFILISQKKRKEFWTKSNSTHRNAIVIH